ncbi:sugar ABC transporter ATP-binding protein [Neobacillus sp. Marseille-QA0830]
MVKSPIDKYNSTGLNEILSMEGISKSFSGVSVLRNINLHLFEGEVHALMGENGAGKSTLMKIMAGVHQPDQGTIKFRNKQINWNNPMQAREHGISVIHQELNLSPNLTIGENILMGTKYPKNKLGFVQYNEVHEKAQAILESIGSNLDSKAYVSTLSVAQQQMVEIARALSIKAEVLVMDEPTALLTDKEIEKLFVIIQELKKQGVAIVYISHRMDEIFKISDRCTVLRDGNFIDSYPISETNPDHLVNMMVGREMKELFQRTIVKSKEAKEKTPVLEIKGLSDNKLLKDISLKVHAGEIVGISGLVGAGRTELVRSVFGLEPISKGDIFINGKKVKISSPQDAIKHGIAHVPESRKEQGLFLNMSVKENILLAQMSNYRKLKLLDWAKINDSATDFIKSLDIKVANMEQQVVNLSGGNQQKVLLARWLSIKPRVLLLDEPTRGVDIGSKTEIHKIICELANSGLAVLIISSELPEVLSISDRILVMHEGKVKANLLQQEATQEKIMHYAMGGV